MLYSIERKPETPNCRGNDLVHRFPASSLQTLQWGIQSSSSLARSSSIYTNELRRWLTLTAVTAKEILILFYYFWFFSLSKPKLVAIASGANEIVDTDFPNSRVVIDSQKGKLRVSLIFLFVDSIEEELRKYK